MGVFATEPAAVPLPSKASIIDTGSTSELA